MNFAVVSGVSAALIVVIQAVAFEIGRRIGRYNVADVAWGICFIAVAVVTAVLGNGDATRRWLLLALVAVWAARLSWHVHRKSTGKGEDPRYADMLRGATLTQVALKVFVLQGFAIWFVSLPLQLSAVTGPPPTKAVTLLGLSLWVLGLLFEAVGDHQLQTFKSDPAHRGRVMDRGLWAYTRHPNYFGDACVWWGLWLITITDWWSLATVGSPVLMTYFLVYATGARLAEKYMAGRPGFGEYQQRTSFFIPLPRRSARR